MKTANSVPNGVIRLMRIPLVGTVLRLSLVLIRDIRKLKFVAVKMGAMDKKGYQK